MPPRPHRLGAVVLLALHSTACLTLEFSTWQPTTVGPRRLIEEQHPDLIRVTTDEGSHLTLSYPTVEGDSIAGNSLLSPARTVEGDSIAGNGPRECQVPWEACEVVSVRLAMTDVTAVDTLGSRDEATTFAEMYAPPEPSGPGEQILAVVLGIGLVVWGVLNVLDFVADCPATGC